MATRLRPTLAQNELPADALTKMEQMNAEASSLNIWLRTRANAAMHPPWHRPDLPDPARPGRAEPCLWKWVDFEPYLHRLAAVAPLEFTERQQFLLTNPGFGGALKATCSIRVAVSIYKPGDFADTHRHTPNASRTILSSGGGYTTVEGEHCTARRGDLILTPTGTWHGHGNDSEAPVIWVDVLDWPVLEFLDSIWIEPGTGSNTTELKEGMSSKLFGAGGMVPRGSLGERGNGEESSPVFHYRGEDIHEALQGMRDLEGSPWDAITLDFTNPVTGGEAFATLDYWATLLRPDESTSSTRSTAGSLFIAIAGTGTTEINGERFDWEPNDLFVVPNHSWFRHINGSDEAILYGISDRPLLSKIGHYRRQGLLDDGTVISIEDHRRVP